MGPILEALGQVRCDDLRVGCFLADRGRVDLPQVVKEFRQDAGLQERWVGLTLDGDLPANSGDTLYSVADVSAYRERMYSGSEAGETFDAETAGTPVGRVTSSARASFALYNTPEEADAFVDALLKARSFFA